ncbi:hypothetical protein JL37_13995 [Achromobacter sp. RTa]|uniref:FecR domain-containing protein n=1 Tax=Achromobacter sp. RTa TaxID=1532557 RepID=UPI00050E967E|nr:FecR domain-containing protein [Achromobacter sp. RTa]KGD93556.1 hypothetical protein JL37_13995 [Achromobacter sp. RTa]
MSASSLPPDESPIPAHVVDAAIHWYVVLASGTATAQDHAAFACWRSESSAHAAAWSRFEAMGGRLQGGPARLAPAATHAALTKAVSASGRRRALKTLAWGGLGGTAFYLAQAQLPWRGQLASVLADVRTRAGERRDLVLEDGTRLRLNTATAVDLRFSDSERRIVLREGEILVETGADASGRPLVVESPAGTLQPVGTRFIVRHVADETDCAPTQLAVLEGAVRIHADGRPDGETALLTAGQQARFTRRRIEAPVPLDEPSHGWIAGTFSAEGMRLADLLSDLGRYRPGALHCAPEVAELRITGAWPLDGPDATDRILDTLERRLPVRIRRYTRYWVTVGPR